MFDRRLAHLNEAHELQRVVLWIPARPGKAEEAKCQEADEEPERKLVHAAGLEEDRHPDDRKLAAAPVWRRDSNPARVTVTCIRLVLGGCVFCGRQGCCVAG